ncbi:hypothetical protein DL769_011739 [Monosporascus sp. CRB-8-3]|nr:hypothetical protein DL769_011739 [Monosporascus sp. CRB-8-3]
MHAARAICLDEVPDGRQILALSPGRTISDSNISLCTLNGMACVTSRPYGERTFPTPSDWRDWLLGYLHEDAEQAALGNIEGPLKAAWACFATCATS